MAGMVALATIFAGLTAVFTGALAFKALGNQKPVPLRAVQRKGTDALYVFNPNRGHRVIIASVVNESGNEEMSISRVNTAKKILEPEPMGRRYVIGEFMKPGQKSMFVFSVEDTARIKPMRFTIERYGFNFFSAAPNFHIVARPHDFRTLLELAEGKTARFWREKIARYHLPD